MANLPKKNPKIQSSYKLAKTTKDQLKQIVDYEINYTETDIIEWAIEKIYVTEYQRPNPDKFPNIRTYPHYLIVPTPGGD